MVTRPGCGLLVARVAKRWTCDDSFFLLNFSFVTPATSGLSPASGLVQFSGQSGTRQSRRWPNVHGEASPGAAAWEDLQGSGESRSSLARNSPKIPMLETFTAPFQRLRSTRTVRIGGATVELKLRALCSSYWRLGAKRSASWGGCACDAPSICSPNLEARRRGKEGKGTQAQQPSHVCNAVSAGNR